MTWLDLCNKLHTKQPQERIPSNIKLHFKDIGSATEAKNAFAIAIGFIRAGRVIYPGAGRLIYSTVTPDLSLRRKRRTNLK